MEPEPSSVVENVRKALEASGYPLEMRVAHIARRHRPNFVRQSRYYVDPLTGKIRETDVLACWMSEFRAPNDGATTRWTVIYLVIECKSKPAPWVVFDDGEGLTDDPELRLDMAVIREAPGTNYLRQMLNMRAASGTLFAPSRIGTGIAEPTAKSSDSNPAWAAVQSAVAAAHGFLSDVEIPPHSGDDESVNIVVQPVVVTSGALCRAYLDESGALQVEEVVRAELTVRPSEDARLTRCLVVPEGHVDDLVRATTQTADFYGFRWA